MKTKTESVAVIVSFIFYVLNYVHFSFHKNGVSTTAVYRLYTSFPPNFLSSLFFQAVDYKVKVCFKLFLSEI